MPDSSNTSTAIDLLSKASEVVSEEITSETKEIAPYTRYFDLKMFFFFKISNSAILIIKVIKLCFCYRHLVYLLYF